ncbi:MAG: ribonuclease HII [Gammaproteobacteria bacterium]|nr:MAG: ribonuclease HII [Gammaproteobacteria bacterium]
MKDYKLVAGIDEAGRGPLAGPVVAAAVILDPENSIEGLADSKKLSPKRRQILSVEIKQRAYCWSVARAEVEEIDTINILQATLLAMHRAVAGLKQTPDYVLVDGNQMPGWDYQGETVVKGDATVPEISAASILAKVERDAVMRAFDQQYPGYGFARHMGYPTKAHIEALQDYGVTPIHRRSFAPVRRKMDTCN